MIPISAPLLPSWLAQLLLQRRARRKRPARLACVQMLSACSRHAHTALQPLWSWLFLRSWRCGLCLLPVVPACHYPCPTLGAFRERLSLAPATFFTRRTLLIKHAAAVCHTNNARECLICICRFLVSKYVSLRKLKKYIPCDKNLHVSQMFFCDICDILECHKMSQKNL